MIVIVAAYIALGYVVQAVAVPGLMHGIWHLPTFQAFLAGGVCSIPVLVVARRWQFATRRGGGSPAGRMGRRVDRVPSRAVLGGPAEPRRVRPVPRAAASSEPSGAGS